MAGSLFLFVLLDGFCVVSSIFTIPLGGAPEESLAIEAGADRSLVESAEVSARTRGTGACFILGIRYSLPPGFFWLEFHFS